MFPVNLCLDCGQSQKTVRRLCEIYIYPYVEEHPLFPLGGCAPPTKALHHLQHLHTAAQGANRPAHAQPQTLSQTLLSNKWDTAQED